MKITCENTVAMLIDFQEKLVPAIHENETLIEETRKLIEGLKVLNCPMIFTQQYTKGLGMTVEPLKQAYEDTFTYYDKTTFSCMDNEEIKKTVDSLGKKNVIIAGMESHICVMQTVVDLLNEGYEVYLVSDCIGSRTEFNKQIGLQRMMQEGAKMTSVESILFELAGKAGTPEFKVISKLIK